MNRMFPFISRNTTQRSVPPRPSNVYRDTPDLIDDDSDTSMNAQAHALVSSDTPFGESASASQLPAVSRPSSATRRRSRPSDSHGTDDISDDPGVKCRIVARDDPQQQETMAKVLERLTAMESQMAKRDKKLTTQDRLLREYREKLENQTSELKECHEKLEHALQAQSTNERLIEALREEVELKSREIEVLKEDIRVRDGKISELSVSCANRIGEVEEEAQAQIEASRSREAAAREQLEDLRKAAKVVEEVQPQEEMDTDDEMRIEGEGQSCDDDRMNTSSPQAEGGTAGREGGEPRSPLQTLVQTQSAQGRRPALQTPRYSNIVTPTIQIRSFQVGFRSEICAGNPSLVKNGPPIVDDCFSFIGDCFFLIDDCFSLVDDCFFFVNDCFSLVNDCFSLVDDCFCLANGCVAFLDNPPARVCAIGCHQGGSGGADRFLETNPATGSTIGTRLPEKGGEEPGSQAKRAAGRSTEDTQAICDFEGGGAEEPPLDPLRPCWSDLKSEWNAALAHKFVEYMIDEVGMKEEFKETIGEMFQDRLKRQRALLRTNSCKEGEDEEARVTRLKQHKAKATTRDRATTRRTTLFKKRRLISSEARDDPEEAEAWKEIDRVVEELGAGGMSSDESEYDEYKKKTAHTIIRSVPWRAEGIEELMKIVDRDAVTSTAGGFQRGGNPGLNRVRKLAPVASRRLAMRGLPRNYYDEDWFTLLPARQQEALGALDPRPLPELKRDEPMLNASWLEALWLVWTGDPTIRPNEMDEAIVYEEAQSSYGREAQPSNQRCFRKLKTRLDRKPNHTTREVQKSEGYVRMDGKPNHTTKEVKESGEAVSCEESREMGEEKEEERPIAATLNLRLTNPIKTPTRLGQRRPASFPSILDGLVGRSVQALSVSSYERESQSYKVWWRGWLLNPEARMDGKPNHTTEMGEEKEEERPIAATLNPRLTNPIKTPTRLGSVSQRLFHLPSTAWLDAPSKPRVPPHMSGKPNHTTRDGCIEKIVIRLSFFTFHFDGLVGHSVQTSKISRLELLRHVLLGFPPKPTLLPLFYIKTSTGQLSPRTSAVWLDIPSKPRGYSKQACRGLFFWDSRQNRPSPPSCYLFKLKTSTGRCSPRTSTVWLDIPSKPRGYPKQAYRGSFSGIPALVRGSQ
ncbi:hypothetical protein BKA70DRAFT_1230120 [Coprinopsis sp. MPI-PUGE-AT-0042]|nr:hypothetical protein BKA70DRAFT_1230120 [Coprinopsis sp. MPI-PUGE-AT-0042]